MAERWRERGSTFTIRELPVLAIGGVEGALAITESNTSIPLAGLLLPRSRARREGRLRPAVTYLEDATELTVANFAGAIMDATYWHWAVHPGGRLRILKVPKGVAIEPLGKNRSRLHEWSSYSIGGDCYLGWMKDFSSNYRAKAVRRIADALNAGLQSRTVNAEAR